LAPFDSALDQSR